MTSITMIRTFKDKDQQAVVITQFSPFKAVFQVYTLGLIHTRLDYEMPWKTEHGAVAQFERFLDIRQAPDNARLYHNHHAANASKAALVTNYIKARKADGYDHACAKHEAHVFYNIGIKTKTE